MGGRETGCTGRWSRCGKAGSITKCRNKPRKSMGHWQLNSGLMQQLSVDNTKNSLQVINS